MLDISLVTYNSSRWLPKFLASLLAQAYPTDRIRVLAVDHDSQDDSFERLQRFCARSWCAVCRSGRHAAAETEALAPGITRICNRPRRRINFWSRMSTSNSRQDTLIRLVEAATASARDVASWECRQKPFEHPKAYNPVTLETSWCSSACVLLRTEALKHVGRV